VLEPKITISEDGSQSFTCSIPKFYINPETNFREENPRWTDANNGILAENTRILKAFVNLGKETKVFPFIINEIKDKRDSHFATYKEVTGAGLAFSELGKVGYKIELSQELLLSEYEDNTDLIPTIDYWLDKVFPNVRDEKSGKIIKWLTPWCYEIRMDWSHYADKDMRESNKIYDDAYTSSWKVING